MPENPLLPDAELRALLALTKRVVTLETAFARQSPASRGSFVSVAGREAALAATTLQLKVGDLLVPEPGDRVALALSPDTSRSSASSTDLLPKIYTKDTSRLLLATCMAAALRASATDRVVLAFARPSKAEPGWSASLSWAQERLLPLLVVCLDASGPAAFTSAAKPAATSTARSAAEAFTWPTVSRAAARSKLPILTVDGEDAVAMYRAMQESLLRARAGGGPALLWAALPKAAQVASQPRSQRPLLRLTQYLRTRNISPA